MKTLDLLPTITTTVKRNLRYKPAVNVRPRFYDLSIDEETGPTSTDSLSHALHLYLVLRKQWRKGLPTEDGVCYVKVKGEFVEIRVKRPKF